MWLNCNNGERDVGGGLMSINVNVEVHNSHPIMSLQDFLHPHKSVNKP